MTCLLIDQGNSRTKLAWRNDLPDQLEVFTDGGFGPLLAADQPLPDVIWLSSVASTEQRASLIARIGQYHSAPLHIASVVNHCHHLPTQYQPDQLGVDRWLAMLACRAQNTLPALVVDCGTAITLDLLDIDGHLGGYILPGFQLMRSTLLKQTGIRPQTQSSLQVQPPRDTMSAIDDAGPVAVAAMIRALRPALANSAQVFLGGGAAQALLPFLDDSVILKEQMVLEGLAVLSRKEAQ